MNPIEGVELKDVYTEAMTEFKQKRIDSVRAMVLALNTQYEDACKEISKCQTQIDGAMARADKLKKRIDAIASGRWDALGDIQDEKKDREPRP